MMCRVYRNWSKVAVALSACFILVGYSTIDARGIAKPDERIALTANSSKKADRLPVVSPSKSHANVPSPGTMLAPAARPPLGCDPMFSPIADPARARLYRRCEA
jgi:Neisseria meningitidis TspB protein